MTTHKLLIILRIFSTLSYVVLIVLTFPTIFPHIPRELFFFILMISGLSSVWMIDRAIKQTK